MRKIEYIFIDSDTETHDGKPSRHAVPNLGYHYVVNRGSSECNPSSLGDCRVASEVGNANSEGLVLNPTDVCIPAHIIQGPVYDPDKYNHCSIFIRYCGSLRPELLEQREQSPCSHELCRVATKVDASQAWLMQSGTSCSTIMAQRAALLQLLVDLRQHFPKILGVSEIDGRALYCKNIIVRDAMNVLRRELSDLP